MPRTSALRSIFASLLLAVPAVDADVLTFDEAVFSHGTEVNTQYAPLVTISAINNVSGHPDLAVAFDSTTAASATTDDDLLAPFSNVKHPGLGALSPENILIIQENSSGCSSGTCSDPDDEGARPAGKLIFEFGSTVELLSLDFFDIENATTNDENSNQAGTEIRFFDSLDNELFAGSYFVPGTGGDNTWDRLFFNGITGVKKLEVNLGGSGAVDNLSFSVVPVPAAVWLFGTALLGFIGLSRRTSV